MTTQQTGYTPATDEIAGLADAAIAQVRTWLAASRDIEPDSSAKLLADVLRDPNGLEFTVGFVDRVVRPEDLHVAARALRELTPLMPRFLPSWMKAGFRVGATAAPFSSTSTSSARRSSARAKRRSAWPARARSSSARTSTTSP
jgi:RHH-type proline utilization regulon transcriptional repressor/proline dehydrogenase/delta 1-pyrroline-5-carboxylate dehydrogenase